MDTLLDALLDLAFDPAERRDLKGRWTDDLNIDVDTLAEHVALDHGPDRIHMDEWGLPRAGMDDKTTIAKFAHLSNDYLDDLLDLAFNPAEPRDRRGRWTLLNRLGQDWQRSLDAMKGSDLEGLPQTSTKVPGHGDYTFHSNAELQGVADAYMADHGLGEHPTDYAPVDPVKARAIADAFTQMKDAPDDPEVAAAYRALKDETLAQYRALRKAGYSYDFYPADDPYPHSPREAIYDLTANHHMFVYPTLGEDGGFGEDPSASERNPLLELVDGETWGGKPVTYNDVFRAVHDTFGHAKEGLGFRARGEDNAYRQHAAMFTPKARRALASETRGQNTWLNYGPHGDTNRTATLENTVFADQKAGILPDWAIDPDYYKRGGVDLAVSPNGRPMDTSSLAKPGYHGPRRLSDYERGIVHALMRKGKTESAAIRIARGLLNKAARTGRWGDHGKAGAKTRAGARASIAQRSTF